MNSTTRALLVPLALFVVGCGTLGSAGDLSTMRAVAQGRFDEIQAANLVFDRLIAQPAPSNLSPMQRKAWDEQSAWLVRTKSRLISFSTSLKRVIDAPHPSGTGFDGVVSGAQLASDYARLGDDFAALMKELTVEAAEDERRIAEAEGTSGTPAITDSTRVDTLGGRSFALSTPLKTRHDAANDTLTGLS